MKIILLLHGALGTKHDLQPLQSALCSNFTVYSLNFYGHAGTPTDNHFSIEGFAAQVLDWMSEMNFEKISIAGYSLGGYVALYLALFYPDKIEKIVTIGTKLYWDTTVAEKETSKLDPVLLEKDFPVYADKLKLLHSADNWKKVVTNTAALLQHLGRFNPIKFNDFSSIKTPVMLLVGDRDKMVSFVETTTVFKELPYGQLTVLPNTSHQFYMNNIFLMAPIVSTFFLQ